MRKRPTFGAVSSAVNKPTIPAKKLKLWWTLPLRFFTYCSDTNKDIVYSAI